MMRKYRTGIVLLSTLCLIGSCTREVELPQNTLPPTIRLEADSVATTNGKYVLRAEGQSTYGGAQLQRVDFYKGEEKIGEKLVAPYTFEYTVIETVPDQVLAFHAVLSDQAANQVKSNVINAKIRVPPVRIEAENATLRGLARIANDPQTRATASNQAKVGAIDNPSSGIDFTIPILTDGNYRIRIVAGSGVNGTAHRVFIDDDAATAQVYAIANRGWNVWQTHDLIFPLTVGTRKISIRQQAQFGEIDYVEYSKI